MSLAGLQDSWGGGAGGGGGQIDLPSASLFSNPSTTPPNQSGYLIQPGTAGGLPSGLIRWDISSFLPELGVSTILDPPNDPVTTRSGLVTATFAFRVAPGAVVPTVGGLSVTFGTLAGQPTSADVTTIFPVSEVNGVTDPITGTRNNIRSFTSVIETTSATELFMYVGYVGFTNPSEMLVTPLDVYISPLAPLTRVAGFVPTPTLVV